MQIMPDATVCFHHEGKGSYSRMVKDELLSVLFTVSSVQIVTAAAHGRTLSSATRNY